MFSRLKTEKLVNISVDGATVRRKLDKLPFDKNKIKNKIRYLLAVIMQSSIDSKIIPPDWKVANVTPVYKKSKRQVENYRPINLTSQICKIFEMIVQDSVSDYLDIQGLVRSSQHGLRKGDCCLNNLLIFFDKATEHLDNNDSVDVIFLDSAKEFDKVSHCTLLHKLFSMKSEVKSGHG